MRGKTTEDWRLLELLDPIAEAQGLAIVRLRLMGAAPVRRLQIMAERPGGSMPIEDCTRLSRAVLDVLETANPIGGDYSLEVSSPGIDRPLTRLEDFETFAGCEARLELDRLADNRRRFKGRLTGVDGRSVGVLMDGEDQPARVPFDWISEAKLVITDELLKRGAEARAARLKSSPAGETEDHPEETLP